MPTRYLKPGVRDSEAIDSLSPLAENLFYRLLVTVDDFGRFDSRPAMIKASCFPIKETVSINKCKDLLEELVKCGLISVYQVNGKNALQMSKWDNVPRQKESKYPAMPDTCIQLYADVNESHTNAPLTETETETKTETKTKTKTGAPEGVSQEVWDSFVEQRRVARAVISDTVINQIRKEADKAGWSLEQALSEISARGWRGFKASWVADKVSNAERLSNTMATLTNGLTAPKKQFWQIEEKKDV